MKKSLLVVVFWTSRKHLIQSITKLSKQNYNIGVRGVPLNWFKSYFEDYTQFTEVNNTSSQILPIKNVVPQGICTRASSFSYINDLHNIVQYSDIHFSILILPVTVNP